MAHSFCAKTIFPKVLTNRQKYAIIPIESELTVVTILFGIVGIGLVCSIGSFVGSFFI